MELTGLRVALTGASGFCGGAVARAASGRGAVVVGLGRRPGPVREHRFWDAARDRPDLSGVDVVVHLAAAVGDPAPGSSAGFAAVNVAGTARLLAAAGGRPVVWVSSASVYRSRVDRRPVTEHDPVGGHRHAYARTKAAGERLALAAGAVVLRPRAVYGQGDPHLLPRLRRAVRGGTVLLPGPDAPLSLTAVANLADACLAALAWPPGAYNIADAGPYQRDSVIRAVLAAATGRPVRVLHVPVPAARVAATAATAVAAVRRTQPRLSRYAVAQLAHPLVLDLAKATGQGWRPRESLAGYLAALGNGRAPRIG